MDFATLDRVYQNQLSENITLMAKCSLEIQKKKKTPKKLVSVILEKANTHNKQCS